MAESSNQAERQATVHDLLASMVKTASGYVYYESKVAYGGDGEVLSVDVYEKQDLPEQSGAKLLDKMGVKWAFHPAE